ncbi:MAG: 2-phospho-L-lactate transferase [Frankia sp.]|nr:2-phospho-L-lactate transferase [Frankia sp.]
MGNTGDDIQVHGLPVAPDLDTLMYTLAGVVHDGQGWGRADESFVVATELAGYDLPAWFTLGDRDIATHLVRRSWLDAGVPLSIVTQRLGERWQLPVRLLPMTDDPVETRVVAEGVEMHFQEYWVRDHALAPVDRVWLEGAGTARPAPGVIDAIRTAATIVLPPSNPVVSIGTILAIPGIAEALRAANAPVVGVSPIVADAPVRGMADRMLAAVGVPCTAAGVALHYGARRAGGLLDGWLVDSTDAGCIGSLTAAGIATRARPLLMTDLAATAAIAKEALAVADEVRG